MKKNNSQLWVAVALAVAGASMVTLAISDADEADVQARVAEAKSVTADFLKQLGGAMMREMKAGGPVEAMKVCRDVAPQIADDVSLKNGWKVTRVGTRTRNTMLGLPDAWEQGVLKNFEKRAVQGEKFDTMSYYEVVDEPIGKSLRFMKAIGVAPQCLACHGSDEQIAEPVRAQLQKLIRMIGQPVTNPVICAVRSVSSSRCTTERGAGSIPNI